MRPRRPCGGGPEEAPTAPTASLRSAQHKAWCGPSQGGLEEGPSQGGSEEGPAAWRRPRGLVDWREVGARCESFTLDRFGLGRQGLKGCGFGL